MEKFGFYVALIVALFGMTTSRPPICEKPPPWKLNQVDHMENNLGKVTIVALLKGSCPFCLWQASKLSYMLRDFSSANLTDIQFLVINDDEMASRHLFFELKNKAKPIPVYQDQIESDRNQTIWSLLNGGKDDFYIYDRCGRLTYYVPLPISFLYRPYAKAAILSTYFEEPCGPCPTPLPPIPDSSNCSIDRNENATETNCTLITNELDNVTDIFINETVHASNISQENETLNSSTSTISPLKAKFNPVIEELQEYFKNRSAHHHRKSNSKHHHRHHHEIPHMHGFKFKPDNANRSHSHDYNQTKSGHEFKKSFGRHHGMGGHHEHRDRNSTEGLTTTEIPLLENDEKMNILINETRNETNIDDINEDLNITITTTTENPIIEKLSSTFYSKYFPNYELVLNKALENWLNVPISSNPVKKSKIQSLVTTPQTFITTVKTTTPTPLFPGNVRLTHKEKLIGALKHAKQRQLADANTSQ